MIESGGCHGCHGCVTAETKTAVTPKPHSQASVLRSSWLVRGVSRLSRLITYLSQTRAQAHMHTRAHICNGSPNSRDSRDTPAFCTQKGAIRPCIGGLGVTAEAGSSRDTPVTAMTPQNDMGWLA
jgi:hypothetical protein